MAIEARSSPSSGRGRFKSSVVAGLGFCFLAALLVSNARAQVNDEDCFDRGLNEGPAKYLQQQQKYNYGVVYSTCWAGKNSRLLLLLPLSNHGPLDDILGGPAQPPRVGRRHREAGVPTLFYYYKGCVINAAALMVETHFLHVIDIAQGGMWQINRLGDAANELASFPLSFLPPDKLMDALQAKPRRECHSLSKLSPEVP
ncbi:MAG TPA: hypothetical protein VN754_11385 [Candidatus Binataceae bacterium]|nr:hypothetical protein [Candidatus Binataceae bacterium]